MLSNWNPNPENPNPESESGESESAMQKIYNRIRNQNPPIFWADCHRFQASKIKIEINLYKMERIIMQWVDLKSALISRNSKIFFFIKFFIQSSNTILGK